MATLTKTIEIRFHMYSDAEEGLDLILPTERELAKERQAIERLEADLRTKRLDEASKAALRGHVQQLRQLLEQRIANRNDLLPYCTEYVYSFQKPTYRQRREADEAARRWNEATGVATVDDDIKLAYIVDHCLQLTKEQIDALDPVAAQYIEQRIKACLGGGSPLLPFTSSPHETP